MVEEVENLFVFRYIDTLIYINILRYIYVEICGWGGCIEEEGVGGSRRVYLWEDLKLPGLSSIHDLWHRCQAGRSWSQAIQLTGF